tara:strand:+ start:273 stop:1136 length:864 start_codon:yes stop_codon:yes gene_type:complete
MNKELYWCDRCNKDVIDDNEESIKVWFSCYTNQQWGSHVKTKKHIKCVSDVNGDSDSILCKHCDKKFSSEGYEVHSKRNTKLWKMKNGGGFKDIKCNNFTTGKQRFETFSNYLIAVDPNKQKKRRVPVGKISPITGIIRQPNKYNKAQPDDNSFETCQKCNGAFNDTNYMDEEFINVFNTFLCECDEPISKMDIHIKELKAEQPKKHVNLSLKEKKMNDRVENATLQWKKGIEMTIEDIDYTEKPILPICDSCGIHIDYGEFSYNLLETWYDKFCSCVDESDVTDED